MKTVLILCTLTCVFNAALSCDRGWTQIGTRCFRVVTVWYTFFEAQAVCQGMGGNLASLHSPADYDALPSLGINPGWSLWVGGVRTGWGKNDWAWLDGTDWDFVRWMDDEPNNNDNVENCLEIKGPFSNKLNDLPCNGGEVSGGRLGSICVKNLFESVGNATLNKGIRNGTSVSNV